MGAAMRSWNTLVIECRELQKAVLQTAADLDASKNSGSVDEIAEKDRELDRLLELEERVIRDLEKWISAYDDFGGTTEEVQQLIDDTKNAMKKRLRKLLERTAHLH